MFLNLNKLSKLAKEAYKLELIIGDVNGHTILFSKSWMVSIENDFVPNTIKALIVELTGFLPKSDTIYKIGKSIETPTNVTDTYLNPITHFIKGADIANIKFTITPIVDDCYTAMRLLQNVNTSQIVTIRESQYQMIDKGCINYEIEGEPTGPCSNENTGPMYWYNSIGLVMIAAGKLTNENLSGALATVDFSEED